MHFSLDQWVWNLAKRDESLSKNCKKMPISQFLAGFLVVGFEQFADRRHDPLKPKVEHIVSILDKQILHQVPGHATFQGIEGEGGGHGFLNLLLSFLISSSDRNGFFVSGLSQFLGFKTEAPQPLPFLCQIADFSEKASSAFTILNFSSFAFARFARSNKVGKTSLIR